VWRRAQHLFNAESSTKCLFHRWRDIIAAIQLRLLTMAASTSSEVLDSLRLYDRLRLNATAVNRREGSNVDHFMTETGKEIPLCHLSGLLPFSYPDVVPYIVGFEWSASVSLAAQHLNTGNGVIVPEVEGLNKKCKIRFTTEFADTRYIEGVALERVIDQVKRTPGSLTERIPCAFIGADRSADSIPTSIVTGLMGYPQISPAATSVSLDDKSQHPLFGRTVPSDDGNTVPIVKFLRNVLNIKHLALIHVSDNYGSDFAIGLRRAAELHAPDMIIYQIPLDEGEETFEDVIASVKRTGYRFIFCLVFSTETHDALLTEGYKQGVAGTGEHNWIFADSFLGILTDRTFKKGSTLHKVYAGTGMIEVSGGIPGINSFDVYQSQMKQLLNPTDLQYLESMWPRYDHPNWGTDTPFINSDAFLADVAATSSSFAYEATIGLGLAACNAYGYNESFSGRDHYNHFKNLTFSGVSGQVSFDDITGTRVAGSALYKVTNYVESEVDQDLIEFKPVVANIYENGSWAELVPFIFNDGTSRIPVDVAPPMVKSRVVNLGVVISVPVVVTMFLATLLWMFYVHQKRRHDTIWEVQEEDLKFSEPPKVIGRGKFGLVILAEYRGTLVAVKRVIPPIAQSLGVAKRSPLISFHYDDMAAVDHPSTMSSDYFESRETAEISRHDRSIGTSQFPHEETSASKWKKMKRACMDEMHYLSKLRHPCITTIMGKCTNFQINMIGSCRYSLQRLIQLCLSCRCGRFE